MSQDDISVPYDVMGKLFMALERCARIPSDWGGQQAQDALAELRPILEAQGILEKPSAGA